MNADGRKSAGFELSSYFLDTILAACAARRNQWPESFFAFGISRACAAFSPRTTGSHCLNRATSRHGIAKSGTLRAVPFDNAQWEVRMPVRNGPLAPMRMNATQIR